MVRIQDLTRISAYEWEIPKSFRNDMRVPVRIFSTHEMLENSLDDRSLEQAINAATLPGLVGAVTIMPDMHQGYGFPIGGVAATEFPNGVISPRAIGYDINCGVRLLASSIEAEAALPYLEMLSVRLNQLCPSGVGTDGIVNLALPELDHVLKEGSHWAFKNGYANETDLRRTEENGMLTGAKPEKVSDRARKRGKSQLGSLGAGNHFIEVDVVDEIFNEKAASTMGLHTGMLAVQIHCGSRGLGHQICSDYVQEFQTAIQRYGIKVPDRELVCAPMDSPEGVAYLGAMRAAANFAFANRQLLAHAARQAFVDVFAGHFKDWQLHQVYDIAHNMGKLEFHEVEGRRLKVCVHRKGATRAFGPGAPGLPPEYQEIGQPVLVPGSMGTASWVLVGTRTSMLRSFGSSCHGARRVMSRSQAKKEIHGNRLRLELEDRGIHVQAGSMSELAEEAPQAYKDVDMVVETVTKVDIARKVARLMPVVVIKG
ncbi:MAG: RNA-splicing ligase RtcB [Chloroflexi bacterium GWB2_49_20]|nr:MAG: RNA-splicing ligase RtcB [Chloroflexi bacterium GWB2_49_20]OGN78492.1 MAG: RNA-splicing ligase RtcB [Chloroflexi bacterium GWC2_49_37]OGN84045.1 MAG: RNA-splicing ligase RtcB [Chloroflexi bacterium GWD2_49_16]HBG75311.1 RNA-splicing ligase RtcB [Anaerolineae bacterium]HCC79055.1 RNA-splicing ligase RtcB [Anaerolineae bacterium]